MRLFFDLQTSGRGTGPVAIWIMARFVWYLFPMDWQSDTAPAFVIKLQDLAVLNYLTPDHPQPVGVRWINRGTNRPLQHSSVEMLLRTLFRDILSPSLVRLHRSAGLRVVFKTEIERERFARSFSAARELASLASPYLITSMFNDRATAERAVAELKSSGIPESSISLLSRANRFIDAESQWNNGHSRLSVISAVAGGGVAGAMLGAILLLVPGIGQVAAVGAIASTALSSVASVSAAIGATGGAIARMLTDHDVDGVSAAYYEQHISRGMIFVSVDTRIARGQRAIARRVLTKDIWNSLQDIGAQLEPAAAS
jgi:hypothetical protein